MTIFFSILCGVLLSMMLPMNGDLTLSLGLYHSSVFNHALGLVIVAVILFFKRRELVHGKRLHFIWYTGGFLGIITVLTQSIVVTPLGVSKTLALGLLGQSVISLVIEQFGWFETPVSRLTSRKVIGLFFILAGTLIMFFF